jgi:hypothetical protein
VSQCTCIFGICCALANQLAVLPLFSAEVSEPCVALAPTMLGSDGTRAADWSAADWPAAIIHILLRSKLVTDGSRQVTAVYQKGFRV